MKLSLRFCLSVLLTGFSCYATTQQALEERANKGPVSVAEVLRDTRRLFLAENDPTYLAYVYYGDPNLKLDIRKP